ncbi:MAG: DUF4129 domain-containing protein [Anaerolineae bacterium]|nr:DUF4129 domain-containing protein [Anaerolineae bacterium]
MIRRSKYRRLLALSVGLLALLLLSGALRSLTLHPGRPFMLDFSWIMDFETYGGEVRAEWLFVALRILVLTSFVLAPLALIMALLDRRLRRRVLRSVLFLVMLTLAAWAIQTAQRLPLTPQERQPEEIADIPEAEALDLDAFSAPSGMVVWSVSVGVALLLVAVIGGAVWMLWHRNPHETLPLRLLAQEAEVALEALREGGDLRNVIIRCYAEMERVVSETRGLQRQDAMTVREFEQQLQRLGLPHEPVASLVQLFEAARYGMRAPGVAEEQSAITCLSAIVVACRERA